MLLLGQRRKFFSQKSTGNFKKLLQSSLKLNRYARDFSRSYCLLLPIKTAGTFWKLIIVINDK